MYSFGPFGSPRCSSPALIVRLHLVCRLLVGNRIQTETFRPQAKIQHVEATVRRKLQVMSQARASTLVERTVFPPFPGASAKGALHHVGGSTCVSPVLQELGLGLILLLLLLLLLLPVMLLLYDGYCALTTTVLRLLRLLRLARLLQRLRLLRLLRLQQLPRLQRLRQRRQ